MVRPYPSVVESGHDWLGQVPSHWRISPLGSHFDERSETVSDEDFPPLSVTKNGVVPQMVNVAKTDNGANRKLVRVGDFAINSRSDRKGSAGLSALDGSTSVVYTVLTPRSSIDGRFVHHLLRSHAFQEEFYRWGNGIVADLWSTRYSAMKRIPLAVPPLEEQRAIADYLDRETARIDALIEEQQRLIEMLKERKLLLVAHAIPKDGPRGRMKWDTQMVAGGTPATDVDDYWLDGDDQDGTPFVAIGDMSRRRSVSSTAKRLSEGAMASRAMPVGQPGTLLLAMYASVGEVAMLHIEATWNQAILGITPDPTAFDAGFLRYALLQMRSDLLREVRSNTQANLNASQVGALWIPMPSLEEQRRIAADLDDQTEKLDSMLAETERFIELARERRTALITAAVTGQIDVGTWRDG